MIEEFFNLLAFILKYFQPHVVENEKGRNNCKSNVLLEPEFSDHEQA